jgi:uncharacterized membrane protein
MGLLSAGALIERIGFVAMALFYCTLGLGLVTLIALRWRGELWAIDGAANRRA